MDNNLREVHDFNDLLFELRNRDYGAYQLRKRYNSVVITGIFLASLIVSLSVIFPFMLTTHSDHILSSGIRYVNVQMENLEPPIEEIIVPPPPPPPEAARIQEVVKYTPPVVVDSILPAENILATNDEFLAQSSIDPIEVPGIGIGDELLSGLDGTTTGELFFVVEVMPAFKGGDINKFRDWVQKRTNYPQAAIDNKIQGRVFLTFVIEPDGAVSNVTVVKGIDPIIDNEAVKAIAASPKWSPGLQRGKPVRVRFSMWLNFVF